MTPDTNATLLLLKRTLQPNEFEPNLKSLHNKQHHIVLETIPDLYVLQHSSPYYFRDHAAMLVIITIIRSEEIGCFTQPRKEMKNKESETKRLIISTTTTDTWGLSNWATRKIRTVRWEVSESIVFISMPSTPRTYHDLQ